MLQITTILHPTDLSETAMQAMRLAHSLARDHGGKLLLFSVVPGLCRLQKSISGRISLMNSSKWGRQRVARHAQIIADVPVDHHAKGGAPDPVIVWAAENVQADLIVMGTHGRTDGKRRRTCAEAC